MGPPAFNGEEVGISPIEGVGDDVKSLEAVISGIAGLNLVLDAPGLSLVRHCRVPCVALELVDTPHQLVA